MTEVCSSQSECRSLHEPSSASRMAKTAGPGQRRIHGLLPSPLFSPHKGTERRQAQAKTTETKEPFPSKGWSLALQFTTPDGGSRCSFLPSHPASGRGQATIPRGPCRVLGHKKDEGTEGARTSPDSSVLPPEKGPRVPGGQCCPGGQREQLDLSGLRGRKELDQGAQELAPRAPLQPCSPGGHSPRTAPDMSSPS